ncbi:MAG: superoxide dismutase family protein [Burkholderiales bacterium]|nr:superoxide dismutase family protein [Burkholderiales bacterium]
MKLTTIVAAAVAATTLAACQTVPDEPARANAGLTATQGNRAFGEATFEEAGKKVRVIVFAQGLRPDQEHSMLIYTGAACGADGMAAGATRHPGVLPSLKAGKDGRAKIDVEVDGLSIGGGAANIIGRTIVVHAGPEAQPAGKPSARLACGVIKAG